MVYGLRRDIGSRTEAATQPETFALKTRRCPEMTTRLHTPATAEMHRCIGIKINREPAQVVFTFACFGTSTARRKS
jgi:hypothetical protein